MQKLDQTWDLESIFTGGSSSLDFLKFLDRLESDIDRLSKALAADPSPFAKTDKTTFRSLVHTYEDLLKRLTEATAFADCITAQDVDDKTAVEQSTRLQSITARFESCESLFDAGLGQIDASSWEELAGTWATDGVRFVLQEKRDLSKKKLPPGQERLISRLSVDGYHGWGSLYDTIVGRMRIPFVHPEHGKQLLSISQANNLLDNPDRSIRRTVFETLEKAWENHAELLAPALNHIAGFRLAAYSARGWTDVLDEPLAYNRMSRETLDAMWQTVDDYKPVFVKFLKRKAELLGLKKLAWYDVDAPIKTDSKKISYEQAADFVVNHFRTFNPKMAEFARHALDNRWIEAENRPGKRPGGFCTSFPLNGESRIFLTFSGTASNLSTIAHELGHAYHQSVMNDLPCLTQQYAMNVAETASTFAEVIVTDAAEAAAKTKEERLSFLSNKLERSIGLLMNIHARFLFETRFYEQRKHGVVGAGRLNKIMLQAQKDAYLDALDVWHPTFWASKLHFYLTDWPFYNFPYTFGFLFSLGIYARAKEEGTRFAEKYDLLLRDTGSMTTEQLAAKHLGADLTQPAFWQSALDFAARDVDEFLALTE